MAAQILREAVRNCVPCGPLRDHVPTPDVATGYAVQRLNTELMVAAGRRVVGYKVGLTNPLIQAQLGVNEPDFGVLFADMAVPDGKDVANGRLLQPRVEAEIAVVLGKDLTGDCFTLAEMIGATAFVLPAIEIVDSRIANWDIGIFDTIADNASSGLFVLGATPRKLDNLDLRLCGMRMDFRGEPISTGIGAACLGHPLYAALWLVNTLTANGQTLRAGDLILTGALGPMVPVTPGGVYDAHISGLGSVRAAFAPKDRA